MQTYKETRQLLNNGGRIQGGIIQRENILVRGPVYDYMNNILSILCFTCWPSKKYICSILPSLIFIFLIILPLLSKSIHTFHSFPQCIHVYIMIYYIRLILFTYYDV